MAVTGRTLAILAVVAVWALAVPLAAASDACMVMGGMCEGPCGASSCAVSAPTVGAVLAVVALVAPLAADCFVSAPLLPPELPPRPPLHSA
jgi:hypothetical protein